MADRNEKHLDYMRTGMNCIKMARPLFITREFRIRLLSGAMP